MAEYEHIIHPFEPILTPTARVLVLGSLPSKLSRENAFYYGNPRNRFWQVMADILGKPVPDGIPEKTRLLTDAGIALWDVIAECDIRGSSDASIRNARPIPLERVLGSCPIEAIFTNGKTAYRLFVRHLLAQAHEVPVYALPSTSPANAAWSLERLTDAWRQALMPYLDRGQEQAAADASEDGTTA
ncbi:MAG: DNA-deoxyinosine glycosylase [Eggerthellaceae bacterium]|jgi:TDG/mug DNA glycosylase family protein